VRATATAHPNIALVKYWGKLDVARNLPAVGSISITLDTLTTTTSVAFEPELPADELVLDGRPQPERLGRVRRCLDLVRELRPDAPPARVVSRNSFPTAAGLASSASGFAALVVAADAALGTGLDRAELAELARRSSGSAARSIFGGFVELELDRAAGTTTTAPILAADEWPLSVVVAVTSTAAKEVGSSAGMELTERTSPYYRAWVDGAEGDLARARTAILDRDFEKVAEISEHSCLKMHAVAMTACPGLLYWNGTTIECMHRIRELRRQGRATFFTVDAGPQVKAICLPEDAAEVASALAGAPGVVEILTCGLGGGATVVDEP
jgi:diphosphomevalonate decarboxylase